MELEEILQKYNIVVSDTYSKGGALILPNGKFINFCENNINQSTCGVITHSDFNKFLTNEIEVDPATRVSATVYNLIEVNDYDSEACVPFKINATPVIRMPENPVTKEQIDSLLNWAAHIFGKTICMSYYNVYELDEFVLESDADIINKINK